MKRTTKVNLLALIAGWLAVAYFWQGFTGVGPVPAWGAHIFVPAFMLGAMAGITGVTVESSVIDWLSVRRGRCLSSDEQAISPLLATVLLIAITIVLAVVLYFMVLYEVGGHP